MPMGMGPPPMMNLDSLKPPKPKNIKEVPAYLKTLFSGFFSRLIYIFKLVWETKPWILFIMTFMAVFNGVMPVLGAYITAMILNMLTDAYNGNVTFQAVIWLLVLQFIYLFVKTIVSDIYAMLNSIAGELVVNHIKVKIMRKAKEVDLASFDKPEFYEKMENANREAGMRPIQIISSTFNIISTVISMVSFIVVLLAVSPLAPFIILAVSIPSAVVNFIYRKKNFSYMRHRSKERRQMNYFSDILVNKDMIKEIRMFALSDEIVSRYNNVFLQYFAGLKKLILQEGLWNVLLAVISNTVNCLLFLFVAKGVCDRKFTIGSFSLYTNALTSIANNVSSLISTTATIYEGTLFIDNMIAFMEEKKTIVPRLEMPVLPQRKTGHTIVFENVSFRYPGTGRDVLKSINITLNPGETVVLVGLNGAGKTTLLKLLTRLYDPTAGRILLDGRDIRDYNVEELYRLYGIIFQDFGKYAVSVSDNITFGDIYSDPTPDHIAYAAHQSSADVFIRNLPNGYSTPLMRFFEDNGIELSIGQWQKLSIARAFYSDSDILILDEPTASLDAIAEQEIFNQFDALRKDKTTIFVSHRLSSATTASKVIVLEDGVVVEEGSHVQLMQKHGQYYKLFSTQAKRYMTPVPDGREAIPAAMIPPGPPRKT